MALNVPLFVTAMSIGLFAWLISYSAGWVWAFFTRLFSVY